MRVCFWPLQLWRTSTRDESPCPAWSPFTWLHPLKRCVPSLAVLLGVFAEAVLQQGRRIETPAHVQTHWGRLLNKSNTPTRAVHWSLWSVPSIHTYIIVRSSGSLLRLKEKAKQCRKLTKENTNKKGEAVFSGALCIQSYIICLAHDNTSFYFVFVSHSLFQLTWLVIFFCFIVRHVSCVAVAGVCVFFLCIFP